MEASKIFALCALALLAAGCVSPSNEPTPTPSSGDSGAVAPASCVAVAPKSTSVAGVDQSATNDNPGSFSDSGQMAGATGIKEYAWRDASGSAMVSWGGQSASGTFKLTILDACGQQVYQQTYGGPSQGGGNQNTKPGTPGAWLVRLEYTAFTGQMGLQISG